MLSRTIAAAATMAANLARARSRGKYFMPQSGDTARFSGAMWSRAPRMRVATSTGVSTVSRPRSMTPSTTFFGARRATVEGGLLGTQPRLMR